MSYLMKLGTIPLFGNAGVTNKMKLPESIIVYDNPWQKNFYENTAETLGMLGPIIPWFVTALMIGFVFSGGNKLDTYLYRRHKERTWTLRVFYLIGTAIIYLSYKISHFYIWGY